jgi:hypothetical protein
MRVAHNLAVRLLQATFSQRIEEARDNASARRRLPRSRGGFRQRLGSANAGNSISDGNHDLSPS